MASSTASSSVPKLPTEPLFNPFLLNPLALAQAQQPLSQPTSVQPINPEVLLKSLVPDLSSLFPPQLHKPNIADTLTNLFADSDALANLRGLLETVNASVTRALLEENLKKWSQELLASSILQQLATATPLPPPPPQPTSQQQQQQQLLLQPEDSSGDEEDDGEEGESLLATSNKKSSRVRTLISDEQAAALRARYAVNPKPRREELQELANDIGHPFKVVKVWFQNTRARDRREGRQQHHHHHEQKQPQQQQLTPASLKTLNPLPASVVFSKFPPTPPPSLDSPATSQQQHKSAPLDLTTKRSTPADTPPPLVINSDAEDEEEDEDEAEAMDHQDMEQDKNTEEVDDEEEEMDDDDEEEDTPSTAQLEFEKMIHDKLISLSPSAAAILPNQPLSSEEIKAVSIEIKKEDNGSNHATSSPVGGVYACDQCDKTFTKKSSITRHKYEHSGKRLSHPPVTIPGRPCQQSCSLSSSRSATSQMC